MFIYMLLCCLLSNFGIFSMPVSDLSNSVLDQASTIATAAKDFGTNLLRTTPKYREIAKQESEGLGSSVLSVYDITQQNAVNYLNPKPIVDTIQEHEKYGNNGDNLSGITTTLVNGYEAFSNLINKVLAAPENAIRKFFTAVNIPLDNIGGRLVGLQ